MERIKEILCFLVKPYPNLRQWNLNLEIPTLIS